METFYQFFYTCCLPQASRRGRRLHGPLLISLLVGMINKLGVFCYDSDELIKNPFLFKGPFESTNRRPSLEFELFIRILEKILFRPFSLKSKIILCKCRPCFFSKMAIQGEELLHFFKKTQQLSFSL